jgi:hypothetical protein
MFNYSFRGQLKFQLLSAGVIVAYEVINLMLFLYKELSLNNFKYACKIALYTYYIQKSFKPIYSIMYLSSCEQIPIVDKKSGQEEITIASANDIPDLPEFEKLGFREAFNIMEITVIDSGDRVVSKLLEELLHGLSKKNQ